MRILTKSGMKTLENAAAASGKTTLAEMMDRAGQGAAQLLIDRFTPFGKNAAIVCGSGNNGGDGFVCAETLQKAGARGCVILACGAPKTELSRAAFEKMSPAVAVIDYAKMPQQALGAIRSADFLVDGVFGFGFHGTLPENLLPLFDAMNESAAKKLALDLPSGVAADTGDESNAAFRADLTAAFTALKPAHVLPKSRGYCGESVVLPVGIDSNETAGYDGYEVLDLETVKAAWEPREEESHKGTYGRLFALAGSFGMAGAAMMSGKAALRCGVGLLELAASKALYPVLAPALPEAVFCLYDSGDPAPVAAAAKRASAVLIGCGISESEEARILLETALENAGGPVVIDADGINLVAKHTDILKYRKTPAVLTPHPKEAARLLRTDAAAIQADRRGAALEIAKTFGSVCILKGSGTVVASPEGALYLNVTGNPGMAKGGSGDVLAGMVGSLLAQGRDPLYAAAVGAFLHGYAGDLCAEKFSQTAMLPGDLIEMLPEVFGRIER